MLYSHNIIGEKIYELRIECHMTQEKLSEKVSSVVGREISRQKISKWEFGEPISKLDELQALATIFDCQIGYILGEDDYNCRTRGKSYIQEVTGLSEKAINNLIELYNKTKFSWEREDLTDSEQEVLKLALDAPEGILLENDSNSTNRLMLESIDFLISNCNKNNFLWDLGIYLFGDYEAKIGTKMFSDELKKDVLPLVDKKTGYTTYFSPNTAKASSLFNIIEQLQKWEEKIEKNK